MWPAIAVAEQRRSAIAAGAGAALVTVCGGLLLLSQSRGAAAALIFSALLVLAIAPGRLRRISLLVLVGGAIAVASSELLDVFRTRMVASGAVDAGTVHDAVGLLLALAAAVGAAWGLAVFALRSLRPPVLEQARRVAAGGLGVAAVVALAVGLASLGSVRDEVRGQYDAFVHLSVEQGGEQTASRLLSGGGNRYDYWRVAARTARDSPLGGVGAGNYDEPYFLERTTAEDIRQPHSLVLQALAELGVLGALLALAFLAAIGWAALRWRAAARSSQLERALLCAALGTAAAWAAHTQVDWIHLLPGITAVALIAMAVLLRPVAAAPARTVARRGPRLRAAIALALAVPVAIAGVSLSRQVLAEHYRGEAHDALVAGDPAEAIRQADRSLRLDPEALTAYYTKAAAIARQGDGDGARRVFGRGATARARRFPPLRAAWRPGRAPARLHRRRGLLSALRCSATRASLRSLYWLRTPALRTVDVPIATPHPTALRPGVRAARVRAAGRGRRLRRPRRADQQGVRDPARGRAARRGGRRQAARAPGAGRAVGTAVRRGRGRRERLRVGARGGRRWQQRWRRRGRQGRGWRVSRRGPAVATARLESAPKPAAPAPAGSDREPVPARAEAPDGGIGAGVTIGALALSVLLLGGVIGSIARRRGGDAPA